VRRDSEGLGRQTGEGTVDGDNNTRNVKNKMKSRIRIKASLTPATEGEREEHPSWETRPHHAHM